MPDLTINGHKHHYEEVGTGEPMLLTNHLVTNNAKALAERVGGHSQGFRLIIPDARGMGESAHVTDVSPADWVEDLRGLLDALSIPAAHIVASATGGRVAFRFAADYPDRVKTLLLSATIAVREPAGDEWRRRLLDPATMSAEFKSRLESLHGGDWKDVLNFFVDMSESDAFNNYCNLFEAAKRVKTPTFFIQGDLDTPVHPNEHALKLRRILPDAQLAIYPKMESVMNSAPEEFWRQVREFIQEKS